MPTINHSGTPRHSGRYPWGSGEDPEQRGTSFTGTVKELKKKGMSEVDIAKGLGISVSQLRIRTSLAKDEKTKADSVEALRLKDKGYSNLAISKRMQISDHTVAALLDPAVKDRANITIETGKILEEAVANKKYIDVGLGIERHLGISKTKMDTAVGYLIDQKGYKLHYVNIDQPGTGKKTSMKVLTKGDVTDSEVYKNRNDVKMPIDHYTEDGGRTWPGFAKPTSVSSNRIKVMYKEDGGDVKDGLIELRRGVDDISLGNSKYAQVRIAVDGTHFMKGMAVHSDNIPDGFDVIYNVKKPKGSSKDEVFKKGKEDVYSPDNPFGSAIRRQKTYKDASGKEHLSALNIVNEEGDWTDWSRTISSQILSKQQPALVKKQLDLALNLKKEQFEELKTLTNPAVKAKLLGTFGDDCDSAAVHLKAAALPRQANCVILPFNSVKPKEIYAPGFDNGESVVLIRHPHGGIFEIPELIVNNRNKEAKSTIQNAQDAIGIHHSVAKKLSGADFDGDTVLVIPNKNGNIKTADSLKALKDFDTITSYPKVPGMPVLKEQRKQILMGEVSNLITDMTIRRASMDEIAKAVKHSMVVIDSVKHELNYKQSEIDNDIAGLKAKYQGGARKGGASTLVSLAGSELRVPYRKDQYSVDPKTGKKIQKYVTGEVVVINGRHVKLTTPSRSEAESLRGETYINKDGKEVRRTTKTTKMAEIDDARKLSSGSLVENIYADYANNLKALGNQARKLMIETPDSAYSPSARKTFKDEVDSLMSKLNIAVRHKPIERQALMIANKNIRAKRAANPDLDPAELKKVKGMELSNARKRMGGGKEKITLTDNEWRAIQAGAVSHNVLKDILANTDPKIVLQKALPRTSTGMTPTKIARAKSMLNSGYTQAEIAGALGVSPNTLSNNGLFVKGG